MKVGKTSTKKELTRIFKFVEVLFKIHETEKNRLKSWLIRKKRETWRDSVGLKKGLVHLESNELFGKSLCDAIDML